MFLQYVIINLDAIPSRIEPVILKTFNLYKDTISLS